MVSVDDVVIVHHDFCVFCKVQVTYFNYLIICAYNVLIVGRDFYISSL